MAFSNHDTCADPRAGRNSRPIPPNASDDRVYDSPDAYLKHQQQGAALSNSSAPRRCAGEYLQELTHAVHAQRQLIDVVEAFIYGPVPLGNEKQGIGPDGLLGSLEQILNIVHGNNERLGLLTVRLGVQ